MKDSSKHSKWQLRTIAWLAAILLTVFFIPTTGALNAQSSNDYSLSLEVVDGKIRVDLTNNSSESITLKGPIDVKATIQDHNVNYPRETLSTAAGDVILEGKTSISIASNETKTIAVIAKGLPNTWRPNESSDHTLKIEIWANIDNLDTNVGTAEVKLDPDTISGLELVINSPVAYDEGNPPNIELSLKNTSGSSLTVKGPVIVQVGEWSLEPGDERLSFSLLSEKKSIAIPAGQTVKVAEIEPGNPLTWRNFYSPRVINHLTIWVEVDGKGIWQSNEKQFAITGESSFIDWDTEVVKIEDNEDGTASIYVSVFRGNEYITKVTQQTDGSYKQSYVENDEEAGKPLTGLSKSNLGIWPMGPEGTFTEFMNIQRIFETSPGYYRIIVSETDGTYKNVVLETNTETGVPYALFATDLEFTISTLNRPIITTKDADTGKYIGTLSYPSINMTFSSSQEINATINLQQKNSTARPIPEDCMPSGLFFDINVADGELIDTEILLEITYTRDDIPTGMNESNLKIFRYNESTETWDLLPNQEIDTERKVISVLLTGFSEFGIFEFDGPIPEAEPVAEEEIVEDTEEAIVENPQTGDTINWLGILALILMAASSVLLLAVRTWKKETIKK